MGGYELKFSNYLRPLLALALVTSLFPFFFFIKDLSLIYFINFLLLCVSHMFFFSFQNTSVRILKFKLI